MQNLITLIQSEIKSLKDEIKSIEYTSEFDKLPLSDEDKTQLIQIKAKIQILNKVIISFGVQK
jgi:flagellin-like hook-associated protein FlgL